eukprot:scaffold111771_cov22-Prasinocladus_malaysianus.AAC.1
MCWIRLDVVATGICYSYPCSIRAVVSSGDIGLRIRVQIPASASLACMMHPGPTAYGAYGTWRLY